MKTVQFAEPQTAKTSASKHSTTVTGAEAVIRSLLRENVSVVFGYPGGAIMPVYDALYDYTSELTHYLVRHEQGAIHAAQGFARASGKTGVVFATSGPGATNLVTGLADALIDSTPLVCITGQVASHLLGTDAFQETDVIGISMPVTKWSVQVTRACDIPDAIAKAFYIARSGRPGPVLVDVTKDAQFGKFEFHYEKCIGFRSYHPVPKTDKNKLKEAAALLNTAKRPLLLCGQGVTLSGAEEALKKFAEKTDMPVACTLLGLGAFPSDHKLFAGFLGMHGNLAPNKLTNECDVLFAVGMRFDDRVTGDVKKYAKQAKIVHLDIDQSEINKIVKVNTALCADAKDALEKLLPLVTPGQNSEWKKEFEKLNNEEFTCLSKKRNRETDEILMDEAMRALSELSGGNAVIVTDVGQHQMVASRNFLYKDKRSLITSGGLGTMGFGLPAAIGAKIACPEKEVIAVLGDGGFQMTMQELGTIMQYKVPVKILILNNNFLGMVRQWQQLFFDKRYSFTEMHNPDFAALAHAYKLKAESVSEKTMLRPALTQMLKSNEPFLLEVKVEKEENVFPMVPAGAGVSEMILE